MKKEPTPEEQINNFAAEIIREAERWQYLKNHGGSDPFWEDGGSMNLVRNHIIYAKHKIEKLCTENNLPLPQEYGTPTPPEVDIHYIARKPEIAANAAKSLKAYKSNADYLYLVQAVTTLSDFEAKQVSIGNVIGYVNGLESYIASNDYISMRRHENPERYLESFRDCRKRVQGILDKRENKVEMPIGQLTIFDIYGRNA